MEATVLFLMPQVRVGDLSEHPTGTVPLGPYVGRAELCRLVSHEDVIVLHDDRLLGANIVGSTRNLNHPRHVLVALVRLRDDESTLRVYFDHSCSNALVHRLDALRHRTELVHCNTPPQRSGFPYPLYTGQEMRRIRPKRTHLTVSLGTCDADNAQFVAASEQGWSILTT